MTAFVPGAGDSAMADAISLSAWCALALAALVVLWRTPRARRGAWYVVAGYCVVVATDKAIDVQMVVFQLVQWLAQQLDALAGTRVPRTAVRFGAVAVLGGVAAVVTVWWVRRDPQLTRDKRLALLGLGVVMAYVAARMVPGLAILQHEAVGWLVEAVAIACLACGLWRGHRAASAARGVSAASAS
jgi:hypothetical protein